MAKCSSETTISALGVLIATELFNIFSAFQQAEIGNAFWVFFPPFRNGLDKIYNEFILLQFQI